MSIRDFSLKHFFLKSNVSKPLTGKRLNQKKKRLEKEFLSAHNVLQSMHN